MSALSVNKTSGRGETFAHALRKCRHQYGRRWGAYPTSVEALALLETGATNPSTSKNSLEQFRQQGNDRAFWFYFDAQEQLAAKIRAAASSTRKDGTDESKAVEEGMQEGR